MFLVFKSSNYSFHIDAQINLQIQFIIIIIMMTFF